MSRTLFSALVMATRRFGRGRPGQWEDQKPGRYSYGELLKMSLALGRLTNRLTEPGEHVGVLLPNLATTMALMLGLSANRRVPCMLNYTAGTEGVQNACHAARVRTVISSRAFLQKAGLEEVVSGLRDLEVVCLEDLRARFGLADRFWLMGFALWFPLAAVPRGDAEAPAVVIFTSGSEGRPKGVVLSHRALLANVDQVLRVLPIGPADKVFNCLPIFHSFGLTAGSLLPMVSGARLVLYPSPLHFKEIPRLIGQTQATALFGSSTFLSHYARNAEPEDLKSLRYVVAGAEKLAEPVRQAWRQRFGVDILEGYGATETAPVVSVNLPALNRPGTVGPLLPDIEARIQPVEGISRGGELHIRGPNLLSGYYHHDQPGVLAPPWSELGKGWYNLGDVAELDADGYLTILGRLKRFAKVAGEMVSLEVVEGLARCVSAEAMHAATRVPDPSRGEAIVLFTTDPDLCRDTLAQAVKAQGLPEITLPRRIHLVDSLPVLGTGKVDYARLEARALEAA
ncbi:MAG TPA: AMP-binding protein [Thiobacillaceae bacterium]|nr:AMP-binding protein [Thiobacillaceae bacterium]HNU65176.1 AMP-binding protein [Thiobacillaceae bacterium]